MLQVLKRLRKALRQRNAAVTVDGPEGQAPPPPSPEMTIAPKYQVRVAVPSGPADGYVVRTANGLPAWSWIPPAPMPLAKAEQLIEDAARLAGGTLRIEPAD